MNGNRFLADTNAFIYLLDKHHRIKVPDALIAATAIEQKIPLLTYDKDFVRIKELDLVLLEL